MLCAVTLGLFITLKVVLPFGTTGEERQKKAWTTLASVWKACSDQIRRADFTGALKGNVSRHYLIVSFFFIRLSWKPRKRRWKELWLITSSNKALYVCSVFGDRWKLPGTSADLFPKTLFKSSAAASLEDEYPSGVGNALLPVLSTQIALGTLLKLLFCTMASSSSQNI